MAQRALGNYFNMQDEEANRHKGLIIIIEFNRTRCGVLVDSVEMINRLRWNEIEPPSSYLTNQGAPITGVAQINNQTILIVDFETIIGDILGFEYASLPENLRKMTNSQKGVRIIVADDSTVLRSALKKILYQGGFENLTFCSDGQQAWDMIDSRRTEKNGPYDLVLSDIEMPRMDGLRLTSKIKKDPDLRNIPVILFSSLITEDNINKGKSVGADAQVSKPDSQELIRAIETCLNKRTRQEQNN